jgi:DEAD/DEAH box helicase domain-containing protein
MLLEFVKSLKESADYRDILSHYEYMPSKPVEYYEGDLGLPEPLVQALARLGIDRLYSHQGEAVAAVRQGKHLLVATPRPAARP